MYYIIYQITNTINQKIYIGSHCTSNMNDKYLGSGKCLKHAIKKYGTMWITNGIENRKIKKGSNIPDKWYKGRKV